MTLLPILAREMLVTSRRPLTYRSRAAAAAAALGLGGFLYANAPLPVNQLGEMLFAVLSFLALLSCLMSGVRQTAECISVERREQTLGLLFLTDLRGYDITLGKLMAGLVPSLQGLLAIVPIIAIPLLMGGISGLQILRVVAVLLLTMFYSLSLGLWMSTWFERGRRAAGWTALFMLAVALGPWFVGMLWSLSHQSPPPEALLIASPVYTQFVALGESMPGVLRPHYGIGLLLIGLPAVFFFVLATRRLPRLIRDQSAKGPSVGDRIRRWWASAATSPVGLAYRRRLLTLNPFFWLAARDRRAPYYVGAMMGMVYGGSCVVMATIPSVTQELDNIRYLMLSIFFHLVLRGWLTNAVTMRLGEDRISGALELLLCTPLTPAEVMRGQWLALRRQFLVPVLAVLAFDAWLCTFLLRDEPNDTRLIIAFFSGRAVMLLADLWALECTGLWQALQGRGSTHAATTTLVRVFVVPWLIMLGLLWLLNMFTSPVNWSVDEPAWLFLITWLLLGLGTDAVLIRVNGRRLRTRFRNAALEAKPPSSGWLGWLRIGRSRSVTQP